MSDSYAAMVPPLSHDTWEVDDPIPASEVEKVRQNFNVMAAIGFVSPLGGSRTLALEGDADTWTDHPETEWADLNPDWFAGLTEEVTVYVKTDDVGTSVTVRVVNEDGTAVATDSAQTSTDWTKRTLTVALATGTKAHRLQFKRSNTSAVVYAASARHRGYSALP